eukprot:1532610-Rhodomonas_salina.2
MRAERPAKTQHYTHANTHTGRACQRLTGVFRSGPEVVRTETRQQEAREAREGAPRAGRATATEHRGGGGVMTNPEPDL